MSGSVAKKNWSLMGKPQPKHVWYCCSGELDDDASNCAVDCCTADDDDAGGLEVVDVIVVVVGGFETLSKKKNYLFIQIRIK